MDVDVDVAIATMARDHLVSEGYVCSDIGTIELKNCTDTHLSRFVVRGRIAK